MKIDGGDVTQLQGQLGPLVEEAHNHLDAIFNYFTPGDEPRMDFTDSALHVQTASRVGRLLELMVETSKWSLWAAATQAAIEAHGPEATVEHVSGIITPMLARRTARLSTAGHGFGNVASLYWTMVCESLGQIVEVCSRLTAADARISTLVTKVAPSLGMTEDALRAELKAGNRDIARALAEQSLSDIEADYAAKGMPIPPGLRDAAMHAAGLMPEHAADSGALDPETTSLFARMGIDPAQVASLGGGAFSVELPASALASLLGRGGNAAGEDRIKVG